MPLKKSPIDNHALTNPVPYKVARDMVDYAKTAFSTLDDKNLIPPVFQMAVDELYDSLFKGPQGDWENYGIRIYPGYISDGVGNRLVYIICRSTNYDPSKETEYYVLDSSNPNPAERKLLVGSNVAKEIANDFFLKVKTLGVAQQKGNPYYKESRYYEWITLRSYFAANGHVKGVNNSKDFELRFEYGWTEVTQANKLYDLYYIQAAETPLDLLGFSIVLTLYYKGVSLASTDETRNPGFKEGIIEIGNPCPPRCLGSGLSF